MKYRMAIRYFIRSWNTVWPYGISWDHEIPYGHTVFHDLMKYCMAIRYFMVMKYRMAMKYRMVIQYFIRSWNIVWPYGISWPYSILWSYEILYGHTVFHGHTIFHKIMKYRMAMKYLQYFIRSQYHSIRCSYAIVDWSNWSKQKTREDRQKTREDRRPRPIPPSSTRCPHPQRWNQERDPNRRGYREREPDLASGRPLELASGPQEVSYGYTIGSFACNDVQIKVSLQSERKLLREIVVEQKHYRTIVVYTDH